MMQLDSFRKEMENDYEDMRNALSGIVKRDVLELIAHKNAERYITRKRELKSKEALHDEIMDSILAESYSLIAEGYLVNVPSTKSSLSRAANAMCKEFNNLQHVLDFMISNEVNVFPYKTETNIFCFTHIDGIGDQTSCRIVRALEKNTLQIKGVLYERRTTRSSKTVL